MPKFDGTGPLGRGPRSGRGLGQCKMSPYCDHCPFNTRVTKESIATLEERELFLEKMLTEIRAQKNKS